MDVTKRLPDLCVLIIGALLLLPGIMGGLDLCDTGFYLTFYRNIFSSPESVEYNYMYYFTGLLGGLWMNIWPGGGLLWIRIGGSICLLASMWIVMRTCRGTIRPLYTDAALLCVVAAYAQLPLAFSYDILTILLISGSVAVLAKGIKGGEGAYMIVSGALAALSIFARVPNILFFFLILLVWWCGEINLQKKIRFTLLFIGGYIVATLCVTGYMWLSGDLRVFVSNLDTLLDVTSDAEASHNLSGLIMAQVVYYLRLLKISLKLLCLAVMTMAVSRSIGLRWLRYLIYLPVGAYLCYMIIGTEPVLLLGGAVMPVLLWMSIRKNIPEQKHLMARAALLVALIFPCGCDFGGLNIGSILYIWGAPVALAGAINLGIRIHGEYMKLPHRMIYGSVAAFGVIMIYQNLNGGLYFDDTPVREMVGRIENVRFKGIFTSENRSVAVNELLLKLDKYVDPGDTLMCYGSIPMVNYLTDTKPFIGCSWPELLSAQALEQRLRSSDETPVICMQKFSTIGSTWGRPSKEFIIGEEMSSKDYFHNPAKWEVIREYLDRKDYQLVDSTHYFDIYTVNFRR